VRIGRLVDDGGARPADHGFDRHRHIGYGSVTYEDDQLNPFAATAMP
jgi:hypothetical protein